MVTLNGSNEPTPTFQEKSDIYICRSVVCFYFQNAITSADVTAPAVVGMPDGDLTLTISANTVNPPTTVFVNVDLPDGRKVK